MCDASERLVTDSATRSPRQRLVRSLLWQGPAAISLLVCVVWLATALRGLPAVQDFMTTYPGETHLPDEAPVGFPAWLGWQHFLNSFLLLLIVRTGWLVRVTPRPDTFWQRRNTGVLRTKYP